MTYTRIVKGQKYSYESYRDSKGEVRTRYLGKLKDNSTFYDKEFYVFPILNAFLLALYYSLFMDLFRDNWFGWFGTLFVMTILYYYNLKWAKKIVYEGK